jgi:nuclear pore complex protein Nup205
LQVADELNLDELHAAQLFLDAQHEAEESDRPIITCALMRFHQRRKYLLDCLRLILQLSADVNLEESIRADLQKVVNNLVQPWESLKDSATYVQKCLSSMGDLKLWLQNLADKLSSASVLGQGQQPELLETIKYQRVSLVKQHESLGIIVLYLVKENHSVVADFELVLATLKRLDKYDNLLREYKHSHFRRSAFWILSRSVNRFERIAQ